MNRALPSRAALAPALAAGAALALAACGGSTGGTAGSAAPDDGVLTMGLLNDIGQPPDPDVYYAGNGLALTTNMYEGLVRYEPGAEEPTIGPSLATAWEVSDDFTTFTFTLREGVTFHDGTAFTSAAVGASFDRRAAVDAGPAYMVAGVEGVETPDDLTAVITLSEPNSAFLDYLASPYGPKMISPTALAENAGDDHAQTYLSTHSAGTGPYRLTAARVGERYEMEAFEDHWGGEPAFTTVELPVYTDTSAMQLALTSGDLGLIVGAVPSASQERLIDEGTLQALSLPTFQVGVLYMNPNREFMATAEARTAMFQAVDWESVIDQVVTHKADLATGAYARGSVPGGADSREIVHDPGPLDDYVAGLPASARTVVIGHNAGSADDAQIANLIAAQLQALGLDATITAYQTSQVFGTFASDPANAPDLHISSGTWPDSGSPYLYGHVFWDQDGGLNHLQCSDEETTELLAEALRTGDTDTYVAAGEAITAAACTPAWAYVHDFVAAQPWLGGIEESHSVAEPYTLDFNTLTVAES
ncbi:ABC transporter substrate-binding protein [Streptomyces radicis]|uniref:ABC transporter substrate-binding protein n=1 Tax=Streptomyces radicis TaxID=1750517 RepID=A0A3A9W560_9ACTN|nr:ABC transporter substrate-binding protein [Streptomyces radicis]RKN08375.1 ABC transporter substrate-binding protein [Streptomyces radicis]RKN21653.1 ABC transporter substrate-binding protein [Streptomyces radicis]